MCEWMLLLFHEETANWLENGIEMAFLSKELSEETRKLLTWW